MMKYKEIISTTEALNIMKKKGKECPSPPTLRAWARKYGFGTLRVKWGQWRIDKEKFLDFLKNGPPKDSTGNISISEAVQISEDEKVPLVYSTIRKYAKKSGFGFQVGSSWFIEKDKFINFLRGL